MPTVGSHLYKILEETKVISNDAKETRDLGPEIRVATDCKEAVGNLMGWNILYLDGGGHTFMHTFVKNASSGTL